MIKVDLFSIITGAHFAIASVINTLRVPPPARHIQVQCDLPSVCDALACRQKDSPYVATQKRRSWLILLKKLAVATHDVG
jgi:hypothetical protein